MVEPVPWNTTVILQPTKNNSRIDLDRPRELANGVLRYCGGLEF